MARRKTTVRKRTFRGTRRRAYRPRRSSSTRRSPVQTIRIVIEQPAAAVPTMQKLALVPPTSRFP